MIALRLTIEDYQKIRDFVYRETGILFDDRKLPFVKKRLIPRVLEVKAESALDYLRFLKFNDPNGVELQAFINSLTTNETYFFREFSQLAVFAEHCLPEICEQKIRISSRRLRVWSAGCSTGEEPYTLAMILREMIDDPDDWLIDVIGTDIDTRVLRTARNGLYDKRAVKDVPPEYFNTWFTRTSQGQYRVHPLLKKMVRFEHLNLTSKHLMRKNNNVDFIFCRNVLIYFDQHVREQVVASFHESLNDGGYIFLGHSESMTRISNKFVSRKLGGMATYRKSASETTKVSEKKIIDRRH